MPSSPDQAEDKIKRLERQVYMLNLRVEQNQVKGLPTIPLTRLIARCRKQQRQLAIYFRLNLERILSNPF